MRHLLMSVLLSLFFSLSPRESAQKKPPKKHDATKQIRLFRHRVKKVLEDVDKGWERAVRAIECHVKNHNKMKEQHQRAAVVIEMGLKTQQELQNSPKTPQVKASLKHVARLTENAIIQTKHIEAHLKYIEAKCQDLCTSSTDVITKNSQYDKSLNNAEQIFTNAAQAAVNAHIKAEHNHNLNSDNIKLIGFEMDEPVKDKLDKALSSVN